MKKLFVLAALCAMAATSQAFTVKWGAINIKAPSATDPKVDQSGIIGNGAALSGIQVALYWASTTGDQLIGNYSVTDGKVASVTLANGTDAALYTTMVADRGTTWKPEYHMTATYTTDDGVYTFTGTAIASAAIGDLGTKNISTTANFATAGTWNYVANTSDVPEPTSGLLLLLGVAGLALRRKQK